MEGAAAAGPATRRERRGQGRIATLAIVGVTAAVILGVAYFANQPPAAVQGVTPVSVSGDAAGDAPALGKPAPDFAATTVDGKPIRLSDLRGRPVWLTFGASWCQPCRAENPDIQATWEAVKGKDVAVVQVFMSEDDKAVADYAGRVGLTYEKVADPDTRLASQYRILGIPTHFFIDREGVLRRIKVGSLDQVSMKAALAEIGG
jgi:cytochrome c biogenesis protein CcmG, thiol:disulfide interchange protein DsbE